MSWYLRRDLTNNESGRPVKHVQNEAYLVDLQ